MPSGASVRDKLKENGVSLAFTVPDWIQIGLYQAIESDPENAIRQVPVCTEDEAITAAVGAHVGGRRTAVIIQNQGLYAGVNALRAIGLDAQMPLVLLIGQFGREIANYTPNPADSGRRVVRILEPILDALEVPHWRIDRASDLSAIDAAFQTAHDNSKPAAIVFGSNLPLES